MNDINKNFQSNQQERLEHVNEMFEKGTNIPGSSDYPEGTIREWKSGKFIKKNGKWEPYKEGIYLKGFFTDKEGKMNIIAEINGKKVIKLLNKEDLNEFHKLSIKDKMNLAIKYFKDELDEINKKKNIGYQGGFYNPNSPNFGGSEEGVNTFPSEYEINKIDKVINYLKENNNLTTEDELNQAAEDLNINLTPKEKGEIKREFNLPKGRQLSDEEIDNLYKENPDLEDPNYVKENLNLKDDSGEIAYLRIVSGNKSYIVISDPSSKDRWYEEKIDNKESNSNLKFKYPLAEKAYNSYTNFLKNEVKEEFDEEEVKQAFAKVKNLIGLVNLLDDYGYDVESALDFIDQIL